MSAFPAGKLPGMCLCCCRMEAGADAAHVLLILSIMK